MAAVERLRLENDLRHALEHDEFELYFQPVVDLQSGAFVSAEALIRWNHPPRGLVFPIEFIGVAEETGLIVPIGAWVQAGARQAGRLPELGFADCYISLNVSRRQLAHVSFIAQVRQALSETGTRRICSVSRLRKVRRSAIPIARWPCSRSVSRPGCSSCSTTSEPITRRLRI